MSYEHIKFYGRMIYHSVITFQLSGTNIFRKSSQSQFNFAVFSVCREHFNHRSVSIFKKEKKELERKKKRSKK